jgi:hypothetical protein
MTLTRTSNLSAARLGALLALMVMAAAAPTVGQERRPGQDLGFDPAPWQAFNTEYSGHFTFVRLMVGSFGDGRGFRRNPPWAHDYPTAETNFGKILSELTSMRPYLGGGNVLAMDDPELFRYPVAYLSEPGFWIMSQAEATNLREYLLKGGFLILDDFAGPSQWYNTLHALEQLLPEHRVIQLDQTHPVFDSFFRIEQIEMPHPNFGVIASYYAVFENNDPEDRMMVMINRDNDIGDYWEWSDRGYVPIELSNEAYKLGVNYVVYALTH